MDSRELITELQRLRNRSVFMMAAAVISLVLGFFIFIIGGMALGGGGVLLGFVLFGIGMVLLIFQSKRKKELKSYMGETVVKPVLQEFIELESYEANEFMDPDLFDDIGILPGHNRRNGSDLIRGRYGGHLLEMCDLELQQVTSTGKSTTVVTVFKGQLLSYELSKQINGYVEITKHTIGKAGGFLKRLKNWGTSVSRGRDFEHVETENQLFNDTFDVRAEDPQTAFLVLTPQFMERLLQINEVYTTNFCFTPEWVYLAIKSNEDRFELQKDIQTEEDIMRLRENLREDIKATTSLLDVLRKNEYLF